MFVSQIFNMKKIILLTLVFISTQVVAQVVPAEKGGIYGLVINETNTISIVELEKQLQTEKQFAGKVKGKVVSICQEEGCWTKLANADGGNIMIRFKDHKFFVPKEINGKEVVLDGFAKKSITSVKILKHYAQDAGKSDEEIAKITEPKNEIIFTASRVMVL